MALDREMSVYDKHLPQWKEHEGKFVLIHGDEVVDFFTSYEDAIKDGYRRFQLDPFLVKRIQSVEVIQHVTRRAVPTVVA